MINKIDLLENTPPRLERNAEGLPIKVWISAQAGLGIDLLRQAIIECLAYQTYRLHHQPPVDLEDPLAHNDSKRKFNSFLN